MKYLVLVGDPKADEGEGEMETFEDIKKAEKYYLDHEFAHFYIEGCHSLHQYLIWLEGAYQKKYGKKIPEPSAGHFQKGY